ncbi:MAG: hypothetical protein HQ522_13465 [Bacteroidetes bacterium]|nr:hypothetical protein [Bacteroidota bacterium]
MAFLIKYTALFKVNVLHSYFLNKGLKEFESMDEIKKNKQLDSFDVNTFFTIFPTIETQQKLNGYNLVFKTLNTGVTLWSKVSGNDNNIPFISLDDDLCFTFFIRLKDSAFYNYTNLKLGNAAKLYYFSNRKLSTEPGTFPLINKSGDSNSIGENFVLSDDSAKAELEKLSVNEKDSLFGFIQIFMKGENSSLHITDAQNKIQNPFKTFEILLNNRKTIWRYLFDTDQKVKNKDDVKKENGDAQRLITKVEQPLTQKGFVSIELDGNELPNPNAHLIKPDTSSSKYYSEIYM